MVGDTVIDVARQFQNSSLGVTGSRRGLKIHCPNGRPGSNPGGSTNNGGVMDYKRFVEAGIIYKADVVEVLSTTENDLICEDTRYRKDGSKIFCRWFPTNFLGNNKWIDWKNPELKKKLKRVHEVITKRVEEDYKKYKELILSTDPRKFVKITEEVEEIYYYKQTKLFSVETIKKKKKEVEVVKEVTSARKIKPLDNKPFEIRKVRRYRCDMSSLIPFWSETQELRKKILSFIKEDEIEIYMEY